jgi:hypothetical protein
MKSTFATFFPYEFGKSLVFLALALKTENDAGKL